MWEGKGCFSIEPVKADSNFAGAKKELGFRKSQKPASNLTFTLLMWSFTFQGSLHIF